MSLRERGPAALPLSEALQSLQGEQLSSVEFVHDYIQLKFDGQYLTAYVHPVVHTAGRELGLEMPGYRDELCARIGHLVTSVEMIDQQGIYLRFDDGATIELFFGQVDVYGPEALEFVSSRGHWVV